MAVFGADIPFARHCGVEEIGSADGRTLLRMRTGPEHANNLGIVHGGAICTLLDICMGTAARTAIGAPVMTIDMQAAFLAPGNGDLFGEGRVVRAGGTIVFTAAEVRDGDGRLVATSTGVMRRARETR